MSVGQSYIGNDQKLNVDDDILLENSLLKLLLMTKE